MTRRTPSEPMNWERPSERFLAYLERLSKAAVSRDREEMDKLMRMRLSSHLPRAVLDEMEFFRRSRSENMRAPLKLMRYVHEMRQLGTAPLGETERAQLGLDLRERDVADPVAATRRRLTPRRIDQGSGNGE
jgi:hypothetical protein